MQCIPLCTFRVLVTMKHLTYQLRYITKIRHFKTKTKNFSGKSNGLRFCYIALYGQAVGKNEQFCAIYVYEEHTVSAS